ncbi:MAG TPA: methylmalonyl Co-A mutase-associated GTPase MeaB [Phaeodactylibacter sp.]|nr:methylmalonyl Co-A mutase-associated GTPase MeaB [Phaeodactylibacter sp.]
MSFSNKKNKHGDSSKSSPSSLNPKAAEYFLKKKKQDRSVEYFVKKILDGDRVVLSQAITLVESTRADDQNKAQKIVEACLPHSGNSIRVGITGIPGVGKSTFIEALGKHVISQKKKVAVLAIDPSSSLTKGSILGDKTRMSELSLEKNAFIRPSPAGDSLGGVARKTRETILLCEAAGYSTIFVETVGVGQSETAVHSMVDFFLLLLVPRAGDELQGIKRGIVEMADLLAVNKADGNHLATAKQTQKEYRNALHLMPLKENGIAPKVLTCSALENLGIAEIWSLLIDYQRLTSKRGFFDKKRKEQSLFWLHEQIGNSLKDFFYKNNKIKKRLEEVEKEVLEGKRNSFDAADELLKMFF